jgi:ATP-dependent DNA helicase RecQ
VLINCRHEYQKLDGLRPFLPKVPFVALTATATHKVREDIVKSLELQNAYTAVSSFDRPNIFYGVKSLNRTNAFREELAQEILKDVGKSGSTIIYCTTIKDVEEGGGFHCLPCHLQLKHFSCGQVTAVLIKAGADARPYHAKMGTKVRSEVHRCSWSLKAIIIYTILMHKESLLIVVETWF